MVIVGAVDKSKRAESVVREADRLAEAFGDDVHLVHVMTAREFARLGISRANSPDQVDMDEVRASAREVAEDVAGDMTVPHRGVGLVGAPGKMVVEYAREQDARYLVVSGRKKSPTGKAIFGSVTQSILLNADCPVVTTRH